MLFLCSAIAEFLELDGSEERSQGWMLLSTLNLLAAEGNTLVEVGKNYEIPTRMGRGIDPDLSKFPTNFVKKKLGYDTVHSCHSV
jgi:hypothetical protein